MDHEEVGRYWDGNAEAWTELVRAGYDVGWGEGHNTGMVAARGARMVGVDVSGNFVRHGREAEVREPLGIRYERASAVALPFDAASFDFATAFMSLMDIPETERVLAEVLRVLCPGGFLQFSIEHPCFETPHRKTLRDETGRAYAREVGDYFHRLNGDVEEWIFSAAPPGVRNDLRPFRVPRFTQTLSEWLNLLVETGFVL